MNKKTPYKMKFKHLCLTMCPHGATCSVGSTNCQDSCLSFVAIDKTKKVVLCKAKGDYQG